VATNRRRRVAEEWLSSREKWMSSGNRQAQMSRGVDESRRRQVAGAD